MNSTNTSLTYIGAVTTKLKGKKVIKHNSATKYMSQLILKLLGHAELRIQELPYYIQIITGDELTKENIVANPQIAKYDGSGDLSIGSLLLNQYIKAYPNLQWTDGDLSLNFTAVFDKHYLKNQIETSTPLYIVLVSRDQSNILAVAEFANSIINEMVNPNSTVDYQANIEWNIKFELTKQEN